MYGYIAKSIGIWTDYTPTFTGWSSSPSIVTAKYSLDGKRCTVIIMTNAGTSDATTATFTLPFNSAKIQEEVIEVANNGTLQAGKYRTAANSNVVDLFVSVAQTSAGGFTASGNKLLRLVMTYETT